ncbi:hypothetical protein SeLEV6574_g04656 [Synchytrium endobioticum]|uniref:BTB domain-containing protein n=1 Tax=Synchytrium endobioticum TaxID=286115 RepID=A0A507CY91_9FUNG|nr:hypothetical protein SeLEV6574_g04656 [Synchytrium endobioticum]
MCLNEYKHVGILCSDHEKFVLNAVWGWDHDHTDVRLGVGRGSSASCEMVEDRTPKDCSAKTIVIPPAMQHYEFTQQKFYSWTSSFQLTDLDITNWSTYEGAGSKAQIRCNVHVHVTGRLPQSSVTKPSLPIRVNPQHLYEPSLSDASLVVHCSDCSAPVTIPISKLLMANSSNVFYTMFTSGFAEGLSGANPEIAIHGVSGAEVVRAMVDFAYMQDINLEEMSSLDLLMELYDLSEKYEMGALGLLVVEQISKRYLNHKSIFELLDLSENQALYNICLYYLKAHYVAMGHDVVANALESGGVGVRKAVIKLLLGGA